MSAPGTVSQHPAEAVRFLAGFSEPYEDTHFGARVRDVDSTVTGIADADPETFLRFFYHHYAFNRAGGAKAGYNTIAVNAVNDTGCTDPDRLWEAFKETCDEQDTGLNKRMNYGAVTGPAALVNEHGNLFDWIAQEVTETGTVKPAYETINSIQGLGEKISRFFVRDAVWNTGVEDGLSVTDGQYLQPMDVWTRRVAYILWPDSWGATDNTLSRILAETCGEIGVSNAEFNQGAWFYGAKELNGDTKAVVRGLSQHLQTEQTEA